MLDGTFTMLNDSVKKVNKLFALQTKLIRRADKILLDGDTQTRTIGEYKLLRLDLDKMLVDIKKK